MTRMRSSQVLPISPSKDCSTCTMSEGARIKIYWRKVVKRARAERIGTNGHMIYSMRRGRRTAIITFAFKQKRFPDKSQKPRRKL